MTETTGTLCWAVNPSKSIDSPELVDTLESAIQALYQQGMTERDIMEKVQEKMDCTVAEAAADALATGNTIVYRTIVRAGVKIYHLKEALRGKFSIEPPENTKTFLENHDRHLLKLWEDGHRDYVANKLSSE